MVHCDGYFGFSDFFGNGKKEGEGKETLHVDVTAHDMSEEKALKVREMLAKFIKDEVGKEIGW